MAASHSDGAAAHAPGPALAVQRGLTGAALDDPRAIRSAAPLIDGSARPLLAGSGHETLARGFDAALSADWREKYEAVQPMSVQSQIDVVGTGAWAWVPAAGQTGRAARELAAPVVRRAFVRPNAASKAQGLRRDPGAGPAQPPSRRRRPRARRQTLRRHAQRPKPANALDTLAVSFIDPVNVDRAQ